MGAELKSAWMCDDLGSSATMRDASASRVRCPRPKSALTNRDFSHGAAWRGLRHSARGVPQHSTRKSLLVALGNCDGRTVIVALERSSTALVPDFGRFRFVRYYAVDMNRSPASSRLLPIPLQLVAASFARRWASLQNALGDPPLRGKAILEGWLSPV